MCAHSKPETPNPYDAYRERRFARMPQPCAFCHPPGGKVHAQGEWAGKTLCGWVNYPYGPTPTTTLDPALLTCPDCIQITTSTAKEH